MNGKRALVIGGSLGGLFTATLLRSIGWEVQVFERSAHQLDSRGGGIVLQPSVTEAFAAAGIRPSRPLGVESGDRIYLDAANRVVWRGYMPQTQTSWGLLYETLRAALPDDVIHPGHALIAVDQTPQQVHATFANGVTAHGDLLIAADGPGSTVRTLLAPEVPIRYAGYVAWRGLVPERDLPAPHADLLRDTFAFQQGADHLFLEYLVPGEDGSVVVGERRWNWVWHYPLASMARLSEALQDAQGRRHHFSVPPGLLHPAQGDWLRGEAGQHLAPALRELVDRTEQPFMQAILDIEVDRMVHGRVALLGDAAIVLRPHTAGGTAKAAADALALAIALSDATPGSLHRALLTWEAQRLTEGRKLAAWGIRMGNSIVGTEVTATMRESAAAD